MEKMNIKVDDLLEGTMNKILEAGDTASFERARCTVNLLGETVSVYAKVTDCDSGEYCGGIVEFECGDCFGTITSRQTCFNDQIEELETNDAEQTPAVKEICENSREFVRDVLSAVQEASLACPAGRWDVYDCWREFDGFIEWNIDNLVCENEMCIRDRCGWLPRDCRWAVNGSKNQRCGLYCKEHCAWR